MAQNYWGACRVTLSTGEEVDLQFDYNTLADLEEAGVHPGDLQAQFKTHPLGTMRLLRWSGLQATRPGLSLRDAGALIPRGGAMAAFMAQIQAAFGAAMQDGGAEGDPGNAPTAPKRRRAGTSPSTADLP